MMWGPGKDQPPPPHTHVVLPEKIDLVLSAMAICSPLHYILIFNSSPLNLSTKIKVSQSRGETIYACGQVVFLNNSKKNR